MVNATDYDHPYLIFDEAQRKKIAQRDHLPYEPFFEITVQADTVTELADKINVNADILKQTIMQFNQAADSGVDPLGRNADSLQAFADHGPYYATPLAVALDDAMATPFFGERRLVIINKPFFLTGEKRN